MLKLIYIYPYTTTYIWKIPKWFKIPTTTNSKPCKIYSIKEQWSFYELKQSNCKRYNGQSKMYPLKKNDIWIIQFACVFIDNQKLTFYNCSAQIIWTLRTYKNNCLFKEWIWNKIFWKIKYFLACKSSILLNEVLLHQSTYIKKVMKHFHMNKSHSFNSFMIIVHL